ncbi:DUF3054 domain-containing protein [Glutamicibacter soli]|uniref:DUF3054 domain-containing protein n=1 Tax=Glutamicibacter soli TaxID=453836 RepID=A0A365YP41_9MICC|nr:DUF3054 domain-containing protein [Glutamicibacter soli]RBM03803.1 DUF3054 domain-containing protein [Glutamicibacter soli]
MAQKIRQWPAWVTIDLVLIVIFALLGRREHEHGLSLGGILWTALPFLIGYAIVTLASRPWKTINNLWPSGILIWIGTVALGIALRLAFNDTAAVAFIIVATLVLGLFLLGRRLVTGLIAKRSAKQQA